MKFIKSCPECSKTLRFPLDRGKIKIKCSCGYSEIIDPDSKELYENGKFDLSRDKKKSRIDWNIFNLNNINFKEIANHILNFKYKIQNYKYMVDSEKRAVRTYLMIFTAVMVGIILLLKWA